MQRTEYQVAGFRRRHGEADGFQITHLTHQDDVRVLTQRRSERVGERQGMRSYFALINQALLAFMHEFDRVFHREDVPMFDLVDMVHHRR